MLKKLILFNFLLNISVYANNGTDAQWTWAYRNACNHIARTTNHRKKVLLYEQDKIKPFTQLIFSWNALRPDEGHFSFYAQVRDAVTQRWGLWHHMADWGADVQRSYLSKSDGFSTFVHVRLEIDNKKYADAFRIKIVPHNNASLSLIHNYTVAVSDFTAFKAEKIVDALESVHIQGIPAIAQFALEHEGNGRICSPVSCTMLVQYMTDVYKDPLAFAASAFDDGLGVYGSWPCNMAHCFEQCKGKVSFCVRRMNCFADLHQQLMNGTPVVVSVRGSLPGALKPFPHGHLMVVVGWDNATREVLCHDPAAESDEKVFKRYPIADFLRAWECSHRLSYVAQPVDFAVVK